MLISIITPVFNEKNTIANTIQSCQSQNLDNFEHIVVDGGSTDGTLEYLETVGKIRLIRGPDSGIYDAINKGVLLSKGDFVGTLHAGDSFCDDRVLSDVANILKSSSSTDILVGSVNYCTLDGTVARVYRNFALKKKNLQLGLIPAHTGTFVRRTFLIEIGMYDQSYLVAGDFDFFCRAHVFHRKEAKLINRNIAVMSFGGASGNSPAKLRRKNQEILRALKACGIRASRLLINLRFLLKLSEFRMRISRSTMKEL